MRQLLSLRHLSVFFRFYQDFFDFIRISNVLSVLFQRNWENSS
jgi:hypothetical protein